MSNVKTFVPKEVGVSMEVEKYKASALRVIQHAKERIENGDFCTVAFVMCDIEGSGIECWSMLPHRAAVVGLVATLQARIVQSRMDDTESNPIGTPDLPA